MKKMIKNIISAAITIYFALCMFYCFVAGAPVGRGAGAYVLGAACFSVILPVFVCICIRYILYLQKKLEQQDKGA